MIGRRVLDDGPFAPGDYGQVNGVWHARGPRGHLASLEEHEVTEHEDGTISVTPSLLLVGEDNEIVWHGWLERGVWRDA
jgi:hypothetical protein